MPVGSGAAWTALLIIGVPARDSSRGRSTCRLCEPAWGEQSRALMLIAGQRRPAAPAHGSIASVADDQSLLALGLHMCEPVHGQLRFTGAQPAEHHVVPKDALHVIAGFVVRDDLDTHI